MPPVLMFYVPFGRIWQENGQNGRILKSRSLGSRQRGKIGNGVTVEFCILRGLDMNKAKPYEDKEKIFDAMSKFYLYIYSCNLDTEIYQEVYNASTHVHAILGETGNINIAIKDLCRMLVKPEYVSSVVDFIDLNTMRQRLQNKKYIAQQFEGSYTGWLEGVVFPCEISEDGTILQVIFAVRDITYEKEKENRLLYNSYVDDLTKLYNRKMYSENLEEFDTVPMQKNLVLLSVDVNGLKEVNDTLGHAAGDELLTGVADCLQECFRPYGRIYRLGGDEYAAIVYVTPSNLPKLLKKFDGLINNWHGQLVDKVSISMGYVSREECEDKNIHEMAKLADSRMYKAKEEYYAQKGVDRRGRQTAHAALCAIYDKVLKINLTYNSYQIIHIDEVEFSQVNSLHYTLSEDIAKYAEMGNVFPDDMGKYYKALNVDGLKDYFGQGNGNYSMSYKRKIDGQFKVVDLELVKADDYTDDNQTLFLYIRSRKA